MIKYDFEERNKREKEAGFRVEEEGKNTNIKKKYIRELADNARNSAVKQYAWDTLGQEGFDFGSLSVRQTAQIIKDLNNGSVIETPLDTAEQEEMLGRLNIAVMRNGLKKTMDYIEIRKKDHLHNNPEKNKITNTEPLLAMKQIIETSKPLLSDEHFARLEKDYNAIIVPDLKAATEAKQKPQEKTIKETVSQAPEPTVMQPQAEATKPEVQTPVISQEKKEEQPGEKPQVQAAPQPEPVQPEPQADVAKQPDEKLMKLWEALGKISEIKSADELAAAKEAIKELGSRELDEAEKARLKELVEKLKAKEEALSVLEGEKPAPEHEKDNTVTINQAEAEPAAPENVNVSETEKFCSIFENNCHKNKTGYQENAGADPVYYTRITDENEPQAAVYKLYDSAEKQQADEPRGKLTVHNEKNLTLESDNMKDFILLAKTIRQSGHNAMTLGKLSENASEAKKFAANLVIAGAIEGLKITNAPNLEELKEHNPKIVLLIEKQKIREEMSALRRQLKEAQLGGDEEAYNAAKTAFEAKMSEALNHHLEKGSIDSRKDGQSMEDRIARLKKVINNNTKADLITERVGKDNTGVEVKEDTKDFTKRKDRISINSGVILSTVKDR